MEYLILFTNKKSPIFNVGIIDPDGILFASNMEDLKAKTKITINTSDPIEDIAEGFISFSGRFFSFLGCMDVITQITGSAVNISIAYILSKK